MLTGCMWGNISNPLGSAGGHWGRKFQTPSPLGIGSHFDFVPHLSFVHVMLSTANYDGAFHGAA